ncbi:hypothetical protein [Paracoccus sp. (in: a-proteobacteria)]|uniref:hypothetical protein n=1 Tax=Paracoccus sp. TaxID=267 RepID=UPI003A84FF5E
MHQAMVALELEIMAKKMDRFGWDRERGSAAHDRLVRDWIDVLMDYPLTEVRAACRLWVLEAPRRMPNEGDIRAIVIRERGRRLAASRPPARAPAHRGMTTQRHAEVLRDMAGLLAPFIRPMPGVSDQREG